MKFINWIKDGIYNKSDSFVALIIICVAAALITWRIDAIMSYPQVVSAQNTQVEQNEENSEALNADVSSDSSIHVSGSAVENTNTASTPTDSAVENRNTNSTPTDSAVSVDGAIDNATSSLENLTSGAAVTSPVS